MADAAADHVGIEAPEAPFETPETLETLQSRHRKENRDLISRTTQKKKQASKKTRKAVNDECERLERELKERQEGEIAALSGEGVEEDWREDAREDVEAGKLQDRVADVQIPSPNPPSTNGENEYNGGNTRTKKPNRAKARLARRAAEQTSLIASAEAEAALAPNPREIERKYMATQLQRHKLALHEIRADGHCLYAAVADQLVTRVTPRISLPIADTDTAQAYKKVRHAAAGYIESHAPDFSPFIEDAIPEHVRKIRDTGEWGGHVELLALARAYGVVICVLHSDGRVDRIVGDENEEEKGEQEDEIWLGYYRHSHGLGEHYNSLRRLEV
jgi:OTU domain-containing protein 6